MTTTIIPSKYGRPGDVLFRSPVGTLTHQILDAPHTKLDTRGQWSCGLLFAPDDFAVVEAAMIDTFKRAYPGSSGRLSVPIKPDRAGVRILYAKTTIKPVIIGPDGKPAERVETGAKVRLLCRLCPWTREGRQGVTVFLNRVEIVTQDDVAETRSLRPTTTVSPPTARLASAPGPVPTPKPIPPTVLRKPALAPKPARIAKPKRTPKPRQPSQPEFPGVIVPFPLSRTRH